MISRGLKKGEERRVPHLKKSQTCIHQRVSNVVFHKKKSLYHGKEGGSCGLKRCLMYEGAKKKTFQI